MTGNDTHDDRELVSRCLAGETSAFHGIVTRHQEQVYRVAYRFLRHRDDAMEVSQEAFARALEKLSKYDSARSLSTWLCSITANLARDLLRRKKRRGTVYSDEVLSLAPGGESPVRGAADREAAERLRRAVSELSTDKRVAVELRYFEGMSLSEIAGITGEATSTLKVRLFRARKDLMAKLGES